MDGWTYRPLLGMMTTMTVQYGVQDRCLNNDVTFTCFWIISVDEPKFTHVNELQNR